MPELHLTTLWALFAVETIAVIVSVARLVYQRKEIRLLKDKDTKSRSEVSSWKQIAGESQKLLGGIGRAPTEIDFINTLSSKIKDATVIKVFAHTGKRLIPPLKSLLENEQLVFSLKHPLQLNVLLKDPFSEHPDRRAKITLSCEELLQLANQRDDIQINIRFYSGLQTLRGVFVDYRNDTERDCFASTYNWIHQSDNESEQGAFITKALSSGFVWSGKRGTEVDFMKVVENWHDYFWGVGILHTIALDFDDTLLRTYEDHIGAWEKTISHFAQDKASLAMYDPQLSNLIKTRQSIKSYVEQKFIQCRDAVEIANAVLNDQGKASQLLHDIKVFRAKQRKSAIISSDKLVQEKNILMRAIPNVVASLSTLRGSGYPLYVASLTDEDIIVPSLRTLSINKLISGILGRSDYELRTLEDVPAKTYLLSKVCSLAGIPPYRLLFIGDHRNDLEASIGAGTAFVEARVVEPQSHIWKLPNKDHIYFSSFNELQARVAEAEQAARIRFDQMLHELIKSVHSHPEEGAAKN